MTSCRIDITVAEYEQALECLQGRQPFDLCGIRVRVMSLSVHPGLLQGFLNPPVITNYSMEFSRMFDR